MPGKQRKATKIKWLAAPEPHNFEAAASYLTLLYNTKRVSMTIAALRKSKLLEFKAKDIFRATRLSLLGVSNLHVANDVKKIKRGDALSPLLLVRDEHVGRVVIADGYHRMCAVYRFDEDAWIRCRIV